MMLQQLYTRSNDYRVLCSDSSINQIGSFNLADWSFIRECYKAVSRLPIATNSKQYLRNHLLSDTNLQLFVITNPGILLFKFPNGNVRSFLTTQSGFLLERQENCLWDHCFPFLQSRGGSLAFNFPSGLPIVRDKSSFFFTTHSTNFSHFLLDFWGLIAGIISTSQLHGLILNEIPIFEDPVGWQNEYFDLISEFKPRYYHDLFRVANSSAVLFCPSSIVLPVFDNKPLSLLCARHYLHHGCSERLTRSCVSPLTGRIIFLTRYDARRARIKNITEIEDLVKSMGGHVVDPIKYSVSDRLRLFSRPSVFIGENSGLMNYALFANSHSRLISLIEPSAQRSIELLVGGWPYTLGFASSSDYVVGTGLSMLAGSPMGSAEYSLSQIKDLINANILIVSRS